MYNSDAEYGCSDIAKLVRKGAFCLLNEQIKSLNNQSVTLWLSRAKRIKNLNEAFANLNRFRKCRIEHLTGL